MSMSVAKVPDGQLGLNNDEVALLRYHQVASSAGSHAASHASSQGAILFDGSSLAALSRHFDRLMQQIQARLDYLAEQSQSLPQQQYDRRGNATALSDSDIAQFHDILRQIDDLEVDFERITHILDIVRAYRLRVEEMENRTPGPLGLGRQRPARDSPAQDSHMQAAALPRECNEGPLALRSVPKVGPTNPLKDAIDSFRFSKSKSSFVPKKIAEAPWIPLYVKELPLRDIMGPNFHQRHCVHQRKGSSKGSIFLSDAKTTDRNPIMGRNSDDVEVAPTTEQTIEYICGLGGINSSLNLNSGSVLFTRSNTTAILSTPTYQVSSKMDEKSLGRIWAELLEVLQRFETALAILQEEGYRCDSFTAVIRGDPTSINPYLEMKRVEVYRIQDLIQLWKVAKPEIASSPTETQPIQNSDETFSKTQASTINLLPNLSPLSDVSIEALLWNGSDGQGLNMGHTPFGGFCDRWS